MSFFLNKVRTAYENAYSEIMSPKPYILPKIYHGGEKFDLSKRWYVYYSYLDSDTGIMKRQTPITLSINRRFKTKEERLHHLTLVQEIVGSLLKRGFSPEKIKLKSDKYTAEKCINYAWEIKKEEVKGTTLNDYRSRINQFKRFLKKKRLLNNSIEKITQREVSEFLNEFKGAKNRNNVKVAISSIFAILSSDGFIKYNFVKEVRNRKVQSKAIKIYTQDDVKRIVSILKKEDPTLLMFIYFVSVMFWRPIEIVRIRRENIDLTKNIIYTETKTKNRKIKIIPKLILSELKKFLKGKTGFIFEPDNADWTTTQETNRRGYYTKKFARFREKNNIDKGFKMYNFRHTFITEIYIELRKSNSKEKTIKILSLITGHESKAILNYIQVNDIELPEDYSDLIKSLDV